MIKRFIKNYIWFWKVSFDFMRGYNKFYVLWGCLTKSIPYCIDMEKWHREEDKELAYLNMDRTI